MTEEDLQVSVEQQVRAALGQYGGKLSHARLTALQYYLAKPVNELAPPDIEGRSSVVATDVADTVEAMLPALLKTFVATDNVVEMKPRRPNDEDAAKMATEYCNYVFWHENHGFQIMHTWFKDSLIQKNGILKVWWDKDTEETDEHYKGLTDTQLMMLMQDPETLTKEAYGHESYPDETAQKQLQQQVTQLQGQLQAAMSAAQGGNTGAGPQSAQNPAQQGSPAQGAGSATVGSQPSAGGPQAPGAGQPQGGNPQAAAAVPQIQAQLAQLQHTQPPMLHDISLRVTEKRGKVCVENVPPEEFIIDRNAKNIHDARLLAHHLQRTISDLRKMGYKNVDDVESDDMASTAFMGERVERQAIDDDSAYRFSGEGEETDPSNRMVWLTECYLQVDYDGDGIAEWRKVTLAGGQLLDNEEVDGHPFVSITPVLIPHRFYGTCPAEQAMEVQKTNTALRRSALDNLYMGVNGRYSVLDGMVNLDDALNNRPGGLVRVKTPNAIERIDSNVGGLDYAMKMMEYMDTVRENRTGFTRYSQGSDADSLNQTAHGINIITNRADQRQELIARQFAETGVKDLFQRILHLVTTYQDKPAMVQLSGGWTDVDPREWRHGFHLIINVGLGTGNKDQQMAHLGNLLATQEKVSAIGVATPENVFNLCKQLASAMGFKEPELYFTDPGKSPQPPKPDPNMAKVQGEQQLAQAKLQGDMQLRQAEIQGKQQLEGAQFQHSMQLESAKIQADNLRAHNQLILDQTRAGNELTLGRERLAQEIAVAREELQYKYGIQREAQIFEQISRQEEAIVNGDSGKAGASAAGAGAGGTPADGGGSNNPPGPVPPGMGSQPGA